MTTPHPPSTPSQPFAAARVYLVGAGPGDAGLITLRGVECLRRADLVLYDYLVNPRILRHAPAAAEKTCLGRHGAHAAAKAARAGGRPPADGPIWTPQQIQQAMIQAAQAGKTVVRLKGGDPAIFARGADEMAALAEAGIPYEVVPGVTAALAAASYTGIPVTHRELSSAVALVTGQEDESKPQTALDFQALARFPGTLVMYMGVTTVRAWTSALIAAGKPEDTPAVVVRRCSWPDQVVCHCTLGAVAAEIERLRLRPPVIVLLGEAVRLGPTLDWFSRRPLFGTTVLVTRPAHQADDLTVLLEEQGANVVVQPAIEIVPPGDWAPVDAAIETLDQFDWIGFSSSNGVQFFLNRLLEQGRDLRHLANCRLAAVGPGTANALAAFHLRADVQPAEFRAEALAEAMLNAGAAGQRVLLIRASRGREILAETLQAARCRVQQVVVYTSQDVTAPEVSVRESLAAGKIDWVTVTSSAIARSLHAMFGADIGQARLASISPVTSATLRSLGLAPAAEAADYTMRGVVNAILRASRS